VAITAAACLIAPAGAAHAQWNHPLPLWAYQALANCETGANTKHQTRTYVTAYGMTRAVWRMFADSSDRRAHTFDFGAQSRVLDRVFWYGHRDMFPVGPWGHGCFRHLYQTNAKFKTLVCHNSKHQVRRWCR
jgi:hypothetical protein